MSTLRKIFNFIAAFAAVMATIGGTAYLFYYGQPLFGVLNLCLAAMAAPWVLEAVKDLING